MTTPTTTGDPWSVPKTLGLMAVDVTRMEPLPLYELPTWHFDGLPFGGVMTHGGVTTCSVCSHETGLDVWRPVVCMHCGWYAGSVHFEYDVPPLCLQPAWTMNPPTLALQPVQVGATPAVQSPHLIPPAIIGSGRYCTVTGCARAVRSKGLCKGHGGGRRCSTPGCGLSDQGGGHCITHGGGRRCTIETCEKAAQSRGLCKRHGGGDRCRESGCHRSSQGNGLCRRHGGGTRCFVPGCNRQDRRAGLCARHGSAIKCSETSCEMTSQRNGYCRKHARAAKQRESTSTARTDVTIV